MALADLNVSLGLITKNFEQALKKSEGQLRRFGGRMQRVGREMTQSLTLPIAGVGVAAVKAFSDFENLAKGLESTMGSAEAARMELDKLQEAAQNPGLALDQAVRGSIKLQSVGLSADQARESLLQFGNAIALAGGTSADLDGVSLALTQIISKGKISAEEINQLAERVPQVRKAIETAFGTADSTQLQKLGISAEEFVDKVTKEFKKLPRAQDTLANTFNNAGQAIRRFLVDLGNEIEKAFDLTNAVKNLTTGLGNAITVFSNLSDGTKRTIIQVAGFTAALGPALFAIGKVSTTLATIPGLLRIVNTQFKSLAGGVLGAADAFGKLKTVAQIGVLGGIAAAIGLAVLAFQEIRHEISLANAEIRTLAVVEKEANDAIGLQKTNVGLLVGVLKDENATRKEKENALRRLKAINADHFGALTLEKTKTDQLTKSVDAYIKSLLDQERTKIAIRELAEIENQLNDVAGIVEKSKPRFIQSLTNAFKNFASPAALAAQTAETLANNFDKETGALKRQKDALEGLIKSLDSFNNVKADEGDSGGGGTPGKPKESPITGIASGASPELKDLNERIDASNEKFFALTAKARDLGFSMEDVKNSNTLASASLEELGANVDIVVNKAGAGAEKMAALSAQVENLGLKVSETGGIMVDFESFGAGAINAIGEAFASAGDNFSELGRNIADVAVDIIANLIRVGVAAAISGAFKGPQSAIPPLALALATAAGVAASALFKSAISAIRPPRLAKGGLAFSPTLAVVGDNPGARANPEVIAPLDKLQSLMGSNINLSGEFTVRGTDLRLVLDRVDKERTRTRGF